MAKDTVRYPDQVVDEIESLVEDGTFESKSEFYRFSAEYMLELVSPDYDEKTFSYEELKTELDLEFPSDISDEYAFDDDFLQAVVSIRTYGLRGEFEAGYEFIDAEIDTGSRAALVLEELLAMYRKEH
ncbi:Transcriptional regulator, contains Arc/MetJ-type RHH (ribbon-helix-helix) DNA-binding domain [Halogranum amylolyticum]|uniref:Transcriptional regulator, contains Arc/MetJ-type RHH (Ribbon-helix-helix) DNA-binding domain n=1 Tax=Halogranum amylolyticum TaxID=660520 RepID=A0A1H8WKI5_9EURY|nr:CopG family transcriptional regulator [Halogranum amylolyticum]SEP28161.1 Transcriptional regulator, contains Arc/MetJ-type RHH (ribbon-helix-helix) DNA-binding domain [Halogranum amylolyticum]